MQYFTRHNVATLQAGRSVAQSSEVFLTRFSVVIPTLDEADHIDPLLTRLFALDLVPGSF
ncbi:hypothetical protein SAMN05216308_1261, partial [Nitrosospira sp. Nsp13]